MTRTIIQNYPVRFINTPLYEVENCILEYERSEKFINYFFMDITTMDPSQYADFQTEKDLHNCGLTQDSIEAIKATSIVTHNGAQHVVPESQSGRFDHTEIRGTEKTSFSDSSEPFLRRQLDEQQQMFSRFKNYADKRISNLENGLQQAVTELNDMKREVETLKSNQRARNTGYRQQAPESRTQNTDNKPQNTETGTQDTEHQQAPAQQGSGQQTASEEKPIDRNKTAPADVKVESIFYCGNK